MSLSEHTLIASFDGYTPLKHLPLEAALACDLIAYKHAVRVEAPQEPLQRTLLRNGLTIDSTPDQRFYAVPEGAGVPVWVAQRDLRPADRLLVACERIDANRNFETVLVNQHYEHAEPGGWQATEAFVEDRRLWEMIGFALADGYFPAERHSIDNFRVHAYHEADDPLLDRFESFCLEYGLDAVRTEERLSVHHGAFQRWLRDLGFRSMAEGIRAVPARLYRLPVAMREGVLAGFMSAWGEWTEHSTWKSPLLHVQISDPELTQGIQRLFWSVGIYAGIEQRGWERAGNLVVGDIARFQRRTNFLLRYKRREVTRPLARDGKWDTISNRTACHLTTILSGSEGWRALHADDREKILRCGYNGAGLRRQFALKLFERVGMTPPTWLYYHHEAVDDTREVESGARLHDLSVTDPISPAYLADFMLTRGSRIE